MRHESRPAGLLATRRLADNPRAAFRAISGLILAVFTATVAVGIITSMTDNHVSETFGAAGKDILITGLTGPRQVVRPNTPPSGVAIPESLTGRLRDVAGVSTVLVSHLDPFGTSDDNLVDCGQLARLPAFGTCAPGASVAAVDFQPGGSTHVTHGTRVWPTVTMPASRFDRLPASGIVVGTDGSVAAIETARTMIETAFPFQASPLTVYETQNEQLLSAWQQLANVVILVGMPIAGCSLAVSVAAGLMDRNGFVAGGLLLSLGIIAATFPLLNRVTGPESARGE